MEDYKKLYFELFNEITNAIELLKKAQEKAEENYISSESYPPQAK